MQEQTLVLNYGFKGHPKDFLKVIDKEQIRRHPKLNHSRPEGGRDQRSGSVNNCGGKNQQKTAYIPERKLELISRWLFLQSPKENSQTPGDNRFCFLLTHKLSGLLPPTNPKEQTLLPCGRCTCPVTIPASSSHSPFTHSPCKLFLNNLHLPSPTWCVKKPINSRTTDVWFPPSIPTATGSDFMPNTCGFSGQHVVNKPFLLGRLWAEKSFV